MIDDSTHVKTPTFAACDALLQMTLDSFGYLVTACVFSPSSADATSFSPLFSNTNLMDAVFAPPFVKPYLPWQPLMEECYTVNNRQSDRFPSRCPRPHHTFFFVETPSPSLQYFCEQCDCKRDAVRAIELHRLPPVLSIQLLRYVYDAKTGLRKKIKAPVSLAPTLDMGPRLAYVRRIPSLPSPMVEKATTPSWDHPLPHTNTSLRLGLHHNMRRWEELY